jgi:small-conductance mechanosensitive channel
MQAVTQSLSDGLGAIVGALPALIGAIIILLIGFIIAKVLQGITTKVLEGMGFEGWMESGGIKQFFDRSQTQQTPLSILGKLVFWLVFFIAITMAVDTLGISAISDVLAQFIAYIPQIIAAILILVLATLLANFVAGIVRGATGSNVAGSVAQYGIIVFAAFAALTQLGIAPELIAPTFLILLGAVALAAAIAFGLGGQGVAQQIVEDGYEKSDEAKQQIQQQQEQNQQEQGEQQSDSSESADGDGQKLEGPRLRREY